MMQKALRLVVCLLSLSLFLTVAGQRADAQSRREKNGFVSVQLENFGGNFASSSKSRSRNRSSRRNEEVEASIYEAIQARLGAPYRAGGTDDRDWLRRFVHTRAANPCKNPVIASKKKMIGATAHATIPRR